MHVHCDITENKSQNMLSKQWFPACVPPVEKPAVNNNSHQLNIMSQQNMKYDKVMKIWHPYFDISRKNKAASTFLI